MTSIIGRSNDIAKRIETFSQAVAEVQEEGTEAATETLLPSVDRPEASRLLVDLAHEVARYQVLGKLASGELGIYSLIANDGKGV